MKTEIYLLRHGETQLNKNRVYFGHLNPFLTKEGEESISYLKEMFHKDIDVVVSSDLNRCFQSASIFCEDIKINLDERLRELNFGVFEGQIYKELCSNFPKESAQFFSGDHNYVIPNGESIQILFDRCIDFFNELIEKYKGKRVLLSTHGGPIRAILSYCLSKNSDAYWKFSISHASLTKLVHEGDFTYMEYMNLSNNKQN